MLPSLLPYLATGVRIASSLALIVAVSIELVGGVPGLGADMAAASQNGLYDAHVRPAARVSGILGLLLNACSSARRSGCCAGTSRTGWWTHERRRTHADRRRSR